MKKLYRVSNKRHRHILVLASEEEIAVNIAFQLGMLRDVTSAKIKDVTEEYLTPERKAAGLDFNKFDDGQFFQKIENNKSTWFTYSPQKQSKKKP